MSDTLADGDSGGFERRLHGALAELRCRLLAERCEAGHWRGELSTSALSTATAVFALSVVDRERGEAQFGDVVRRGVNWLSKNANDDGGWGDTVRSQSNLSTTLLCWAALRGVASRAGGASSLAATTSDFPALAGAGESVTGAEAWIERRVGSLEPQPLAEAVVGVYGEDQTFSVPILTMAALAGVLGPEDQAWERIPQLPFELAAMPRDWFRTLGLRVVSYALPALIAIGQVRHVRRPSRNPLTRWTRQATRTRTLRLLQEIQPESGGYLEAIPLTAFVTMSLASSDRVDDPVVERALKFLLAAQRADGSWPIDSDLATWVTTLAVNALAAGGELDVCLSRQEQAHVRAWLREQQYLRVHEYTLAAPGGWAWTDLSGGVPDADDTAGALLALRNLSDDDGVGERHAAASACRWLLGLQNSDGGVPTFCRGWGKLPFDRSGTDLTAHALRAWRAWESELPAERASFKRDIMRARGRALEFLAKRQATDGSWEPLWFGNEAVEGYRNPTFGTARVLLALAAEEDFDITAAAKGLRWLVSAQEECGGWNGGSGDASPSVEETALAVETLSSWLMSGRLPSGSQGELHAAWREGVEWLVRQVEGGEALEAAPIGFYFANLWYYEKLYPLVFTTAALGRAAQV